MKKFAVITDTHFEEQFPIENGADAKKNWEIILKDVLKREINHIVFNGDIGTEESNKWFFDSLKKYDINYNVILGNHDTFSSAIKHYNPGLPENRNELYYSIEESNHKYIFLDSSTNIISPIQLEWLRENIITNKNIVLFIHHPVLETGATPQREYPLYESDKLKNMLTQTGKEINIFCGHLHLNDERSEGNINQFVTPSACYQAKRNSATTEKDNINFGYRVVEINNGIVSSEVIMFKKE
ncbi:MAG: hypothetical protein A2068_05345 [Ignavibacteria bacterium GWB2_35_6b]|nr:MAG: hypothetical protein A2068_05345 [Ignavibacteria bacterium GWB2_35_6b]